MTDKILLIELGPKICCMVDREEVMPLCIITLHALLMAQQRDVNNFE